MVRWVLREKGWYCSEPPSVWLIESESGWQAWQYTTGNKTASSLSLEEAKKKGEEFFLQKVS